MKNNRIMIVAITLLLLTSCGSSKVATKTANTTSKTVNDVISEKTNANANASDTSHGGNVTNPNDKSNKTTTTKKVLPAGQINGGSNLKRTTNNGTGKVTNASDIDIDLTRLSSTMVYSEVYNMMNTPESYVGKMVRMGGKLAVYKYPERNYYTCIIADATACCQQGMEFMLAGSHKYPDDYPNEGDNIMVTGVFDIYYETGADGQRSKYCQLKDAALLRK